MATKLNDEPILRLLSSGDNASNELYYHDNVMILSDISTVNSPSPNPIKVRVCASRMQTDSIEKSHILFERQRNVIQEICIL